MKHFIKKIALISSVGIIGLASTSTLFSTQTANAASKDANSHLAPPSMIAGPDGGTSSNHEETRNGQLGMVYHVSMHFEPNEVVNIKQNIDQLGDLGGIIPYIPWKLSKYVGGAITLMANGYYANYFQEAYSEGRGLHWEYNLWIPYSSYYAEQITDEQIYTE